MSAGTRTWRTGSASTSAEKLAKVELLSPYVRRVDVEVARGTTRSSARTVERVELTLRAKGPVIRAEAAADDRFGALDLAIDKLNERLRRDRDRRKDHGTTRCSHPWTSGPSTRS